jgi:hypothetical protein
MSELTQCNWCTLNMMTREGEFLRLKAENGEITRYEISYEYDEIGIRKEVGEKRVGSFLQLTNHCVC